MKSHGLIAKAVVTVAYAGEVGSRRCLRVTVGREEPLSQSSCKAACLTLHISSQKELFKST